MATPKKNMGKMLAETFKKLEKPSRLEGAFSKALFPGRKPAARKPPDASPVKLVTPTEHGSSRQRVNLPLNYALLLENAANALSALIEEALCEANLRDAKNALDALQDEERCLSPSLRNKLGLFD